MNYKNGIMHFRQKKAQLLLPIDCVVNRSYMKTEPASAGNVCQMLRIMPKSVFLCIGVSSTWFNKNFFRVLISRLLNFFLRSFKFFFRKLGFIKSLSSFWVHRLPTLPSKGYKAIEVLDNHDHKVI